MEIDPVAALQQQLPWSGPMAAAVSHVTLKATTPTALALEGLTVPPLSLIVVQIDPC